MQPALYFLPLAFLTGLPVIERPDLARFQNAALREAIDEELNPPLRNWAYAADPIRIGQTETLTLTPYAPTNLIIMCGKGSINISYKDGTVTFNNCDPDEAARQFWWKVSAAWPYFRSGIIADYEMQRLKLNSP